MADRVLVTGISGFIGGHVALGLLQAGYMVRGSLRDMRRVGEVTAALGRPGAELSRLEFVQLDLTDDRGWRAALAGCRYLQHVASPIAVRMPRHRNALVEPAVSGVRRALGAALAADVERIVMTSSAAAVSYGHAAGRSESFTGADWSAVAGDDVNAYTESKTRAELEAWSLVEEQGRRQDFAAINPTVVLGPLLAPDPGVSPVLIQRLLEGIPFAARVALNLVDVRDVAALHLAAMRTPGAGGQRYIASATPMTLVELIEALRAAFPAYARRLPRFVAPDWLVRLYARVHPEARDHVRELGRVRRFDTRPAEALLGRPFITPRLAAAATAQSLVDFGLVRPPPDEKRG
ncbi:MAG TPA: NAD-dependent epimerase/dehydratase family protein [Alphaproteobacteria bacterium]|nr:NAD-dependent epimerase/dehydratase family protein [Alphaproteobacteria bacterium]